MQKKIILVVFLIVALGMNYQNITNFFTEKVIAQSDSHNIPDIESETIVVGAFKLTLSGNRLQYEGAGQSGFVEFPFPKPCQFSKNTKGEIRVVNTITGRNQLKTKTLLIEAYEEIEPFVYKNIVKKQYYCYTRAIVIFEDKIMLSKMSGKGVDEPLKLGDQCDEKVYHIFAYETVPITALEVKEKG